MYFSILKLASLSSTRAELANPGKLIEVMKTNREGLAATHGEPGNGAIVTPSHSAVLACPSAESHRRSNSLPSARDSLGRASSRRIAFAIRHHDDHWNGL